MPALAYIVCEARANTTLPLNEGADWQAEAHFLVPQPSEFKALLDGAGMGDRLHPPNLSSLISADILFEDGDIEGQTQVTVDELPLLYPLAPADLLTRLQAWEAFLRAMEAGGQITRLIIWFIR